MTGEMVHDPECLFNFEYVKQDCTCGLTALRVDFYNHHPWTREAFEEWRAAVIRKFEETSNAK